MQLPPKRERLRADNPYWERPRVTTAILLFLMTLQVAWLCWVVLHEIGWGYSHLRSPLNAMFKISYSWDWKVMLA